MMRYALAAALSLASFGIAWDENFPLYCGEEHDQFCIQPLSNACYACIHPIETSCPGAEDGNGFKECFCPVPSKTMDAITACINDPSTLCDVERGVLDALNVECQAFNNNMCAVYDPKTKKVSLQSCDGEPVSSVPPASSSVSPVSSSAAPVSSSTAAASSSAATVSSKPASVTASHSASAAQSTSQPAATSGPAVVPPTGGANALAAGGNIVALLAGAAALVL